MFHQTVKEQIEWNRMNSTELLTKFQQQFADVIGEVSGLEILQIESQTGKVRASGIDLIVRLKTPTKDTSELLVEAKATAYPSQISHRQSQNDPQRQ